MVDGERVSVMEPLWQRAARCVLRKVGQSAAASVILCTSHTQTHTATAAAPARLHGLIYDFNLPAQVCRPAQLQSSQRRLVKLFFKTTFK